MIVDHNKIQSDLSIEKTSSLGDLEVKFKAFGWNVKRCNGHNLYELENIFSQNKKISDMPQVLIADTIKGKGVSFMEKVSEDGFYKYHSGAPSHEDYIKALHEIGERVDKTLRAIGEKEIYLTETDLPDRIILDNPQRLVKAYSDELVTLAESHKDIIAMDADLVLDTGLIPFKKRFPERYVEAGIAEQDMVSMAGGLALKGKLPIVHSFACFLSTRPNEQIYNNATELTKIIYTGSLAGLLPATPGHSHQSVRDISALGSIPGLTLVEPSNEEEVKLLLRWAVEVNKTSTYIRLVSIPIEIPFTLPKNYELKKGCGVEIKTGKNIAIVAYGPVMLTEAYRAAELLEKKGKHIAVYNMPWLNYIDPQWVKSTLVSYKNIITIDDHYLQFAQGGLLAETIQRVLAQAPKITRLGLSEIPKCGAVQEVLRYHKLDADSLVEILNSL